MKYFPSLFQAIQHLIQRHAVTEPASNSHTNHQQQPTNHEPKQHLQFNQNSSSTEYQNFTRKSRFERRISRQILQM